MKPDAYSGEARLGRIRDKEAVINELSYVDPMTPSLGETVKKLRDKLYACGSCGHDDNIRLKNEFESAADRLFKERDRIREEYKRQKEGIILEAERLSYSTDYKSAKDQMQSLRERCVGISIIRIKNTHDRRTCAQRCFSNRVSPDRIQLSGGTAQRIPAIAAGKSGMQH